MTVATRGRLVALTHVPSPNMQQCERTFVDEETIDLALATRQHSAYCDALRTCGAEVIRLDVNRELPDCVFIEDTAIVLDELAVMMSPGAESRRPEPDGIEPMLRAFRRIAHIRLPATIDGGDVVRSGRDLYVGQSPRTNNEAIDTLRRIVQPVGYSVTGIPVHGCLHLKTACSALPDGQFLVNGDWIDTSELRGELVPVAEPWSGDVLVIGNRVIMSDSFPRTARVLEDTGLDVMPVDVSEFAKAEGGVTCLSLVFEA